MTLLRTFAAFIRLWSSQSINRKKRPSTLCRPRVEQLETRNLLSASTFIAVADGPFTTYNNTPITIPVLANDTISGPISIIILPNPLYGNAVVNPDNTVTYTPFVNAVGAKLFQYEITDGVYTSIASVHLNIGVDPYVIYQADVSLANQLYRDNVFRAAAKYQMGIDDATADAMLIATLNGALANATTDAAALQARANAATSLAVAAFGASLDSDYDIFSAAWDAADNNQMAQQQAVANFNAAVGIAYDQYQAVLDATLVVVQSGVTAIQAQLDTSVSAADQAWHSATFAALITYNSAVQAPLATFVAAEQAAWDALLATTSGTLLVSQLRQQTPPVEPERVKHLTGVPLPPPLKVEPNPDGTGGKIKIPILKINFEGLPGKPEFLFTPLGDFNFYPKPGKPYFDYGILFGLKFNF